MQDDVEDRDVSRRMTQLDEQIESIRARMWKGEYHEAIERKLHEAHNRAIQQGDMALQGQALRLLGTLAYLVMNLEQARTYINRAQALALRLKDTAEMLALGANLGFIYRAQGDAHAAIRHFQPFVDKLEMVEITPNLVRPAATVLGRYTVCLVLVHEYAEAEKRLRQLEPIMARYDVEKNPEEAAAFRAYIAFCWASVHMERGEYKAARYHCDQLAASNRLLGRPADRVLTDLMYLRLTLLPPGSDEAKEMAWRNLLATVQPFLIEKTPPTVLHHIAQYGFLEEADYYAVHGLPQWAQRCAEQALRLFERIDHAAMIAKTRAFLDGLGQ